MKLLLYSFQFDHIGHNWNPRDNKSLQLFKTLQSIIVDLSSAVV